MKKIILSAILALAGIAGASAEYSAAQKAFISEIESYLSSKGYHPERQPDGLVFTSNDKTFYVEVDETESNPFLVSVCRYVPFGDNISRDAVVAERSGLNEAALEKTIAKDNNVVVVSEMWTVNSTDFKAAFPYLLKAADENSSIFY